MQPRHKKIITTAIILLVLAINLILGLTRLEKYSAVDEPYWTYGRISKFWNSVKDHKWKSTNVNDKPGITVAIISGAGLTQIDPMPYKSLRGKAKSDEQLNTINKINFYFRLPIFLFCAAMLPLFYFFIRKLFDPLIALTAFIFISLSPILLGISLIINPDSLLWIFLPFSLLTYFIFHKDMAVNQKYLYLSGFFLGLALLTKYVSNILYVFFFLIPFFEYIFLEQKPDILNYLKQSAKNYLILVAVSMATFSLFYPAVWVDIDKLLKGTLLSKAFETTWPFFAGIVLLIIADAVIFKSRGIQWLLNIVSAYKKILLQLFLSLCLLLIVLVFLNTYSGMSPFDFEAILASPKGVATEAIALTTFGQFLANIYSLIFGISPLALVLFVAAFLHTMRKSNNLASLESRIVFYFIFFIFFYYTASLANHVVATVRYQITLYPLALIIAAIGLARTLVVLNIKKYEYIFFIFCLTLLLSSASLFAVRPFYFSYASSLLPQKYLLNLKDMGDGSYEAADFLNKLPDAKNMTIWSDKGAVCAVFYGKCINKFKASEMAKANFDYFVISSGRKSRTLKLAGSINDIYDFREAYTSAPVFHDIILDNRSNNYVKIINAKDIRK